jgi:hypothetical protein
VIMRYIYNNENFDDLDLRQPYLGMISRHAGHAPVASLGFY